MLKSFRFFTVMTICFATLTISAAHGADIGVVDMERLIKLHPRTQEDREILEKYVADYEAERKSMVEQLKAMSEQFEQLRADAVDEALSEDARSEKEALAKVKLGELRELDRRIRETAAERQKELTSQELRMRQRVVAEITEILKTVATQKKLDFVLTSKSNEVSGYGAVLHYPESADITESVIEAITRGESDGE